MTNPLQDIQRLLPLLDMAFQAEQMKMAKIARRISDLKQSLLDLDRPARAEPLSPATLAGADLRWDTWAHERKLLINQELIVALRNREAVRGHMIAALSKLEAAKRIETRAQRDVRQIAQRRASW
jgi:hypothetical protein